MVMTDNDSYTQRNLFGADVRIVKLDGTKRTMALISKIADTDVLPHTVANWWCDLNGMQVQELVLTYDILRAYCADYGIDVSE